MVKSSQVSDGDVRDRQINANTKIGARSYRIHINEIDEYKSRSLIDSHVWVGAERWSVGGWGSESGDFSLFLACPRDSTATGATPQR